MLLRIEILVVGNPLELCEAVDDARRPYIEAEFLSSVGILRFDGNLKKLHRSVDFLDFLEKTLDNLDTLGGEFVR